MPNRTEAMRRKPTPKPPGDYRSLRLFSTLLAISQVIPTCWTDSSTELQLDGCAALTPESSQA
jgi:hypothetical protein